MGATGGWAARPRCQHLVTLERCRKEQFESRWILVSDSFLFQTQENTALVDRVDNRLICYGIEGLFAADHQATSTSLVFETPL